MSTCTRFRMGTAWAALVSALAHLCSGAVHAQGVLDLREQSLHVQESGATCVDQTRPPEKRVSACTQVIRALAAAQTERPIDAEGRNTRVLEKQNLAKAYDDRANALNALGQRDAAIADFIQAIGLDPGDLLALFGRSSLYLAANRPRLAISDLNQVIRADPKSGTAFYNRGVAYQLSRQPGKALEDYRSAVRLLPSFAPARTALERLLDAKGHNAAALSASNQPQRSRGDLSRAVAKNDSDSVAYLNGGVAKQHLGNLQGAIADYSRSIALTPSAAAYFDRASGWGGRRTRSAIGSAPQRSIRHE